MNTETRERVKAVMEECVAQYAPKLRQWDGQNIWQAYPFHRLFFTSDEISAARGERSIVTSMGASLYPRLAMAIAQERFRNVVLEHTVEGTLNDAACNLLEQIVTELRAPQQRGQERRTPNSEAELGSILAATGGDPRAVAVTADFYIADFTGGPLFVELKTPRPNLDIAAESKRKVLYFLAMMSRQGVTGAQAFLGFTYNPYVTREQYKHGPTRRIMDIGKEVLIGSETWDLIGGPGTYDALLEIIAEINPE